jgi:hypothetical protein
MSISVVCEHCGWKADVKDASAGKKGKCPTCGEPVVVPLASEAADLEAAAAAALLQDDEGSAPPPPHSYGPPRMASPYSPNRSPDRAPTSPAKKFEYKIKSRGDTKRREGNRSGVHPGIWIGLLMMAGAAIWFFVALAAGWIFFYPPILFVVGLVRFLYGLAGRDDA